MKLETGKIYIYKGGKSNIRGELVECLATRSNSHSGKIKLVNPIMSEYDNRKWWCSSIFLTPYNDIRNPDWKI